MKLERLYLMLPRDLQDQIMLYGNPDHRNNTIRVCQQLNYLFDEYAYQKTKHVYGHYFLNMFIFNKIHEYESETKRAKRIQLGLNCKPNKRYWNHRSWYKGIHYFM